MRFPLLLLVPILLAASLGNPTLAHAHPAAGEIPSLAPLVKASAPAVVNIATRGEKKMETQPHPFFDHPFFKDFFGDRPRPRPQPQTRQTRSVGSGVIVDSGARLSAHQPSRHRRGGRNRRDPERPPGA